MMKRLLLIISLLSFFVAANAQTSLYQEGFEGTPGVTTGGTQFWGSNTTLYHTGIKSYSSHILNNGDSSALLTTSFSAAGKQKVYLEFSHICKIEFFDAAEVYVSNNNGSTWTKLTAAQYMGASQNFGASSGHKFGSHIYNDWLPGTPAIPDNTWWKDEKFDISAIAGNQAQVKVMFLLRELNNTIGSENWGWVVDDIKVWTPPAQEASLVAWTLPFALPSGCGVDQETVQVRIHNAGSTAITGNLTASFQRAGQNAVTEAVTTSVPVGDTITYTFTSKVDLFTAVDTTYQVKVWLTLTGDPIQTNDTITKILQSKVPLASPVVSNVTIPYATSTTLTALHQDSVSWYSDVLATNMIKKGSTFTTPVLFDTTTYYVQAAIETSQSYYVGATGPSIGTTSAYANTTYYHFFDVLYPTGLTIETIDLYPSGTINSAFTVEIQNSSGTPLMSYSGVTTVTGGATVQVVPVNFTIPQGTAYRIRFAVSPGFTRNTTGATFPYVVPGVISINGNSFSGYPQYYYWFYNWKVTTGGGVAGCPSKVIPVKVNISGIPTQNAGVQSVNSPVGVSSPGVSYPVNVTLKNFGSDTLKKVNIYYTVNGTVRPVYQWTGNLPYGQTAQVNIGAETLANGIFNLKAWTSMPNDSIDGYTLNDTATAQALVCFSGTFSVGGVGADFEELTDAVAALNLVGVCGPVVFEIEPGTYNGPITINSVNGASAVNTITFQSALLDSTTVEITSASAATVKLNGADYVTLRALTISTTLTAATSAVELTGGADYNTITNCVLTAAGSSTSTSRVISSSTGNDQYNLVENNLITGGYTGIYFYGASSSSTEKGNVLRNNEITDFYYYGIYAYGQDSVLMEKNRIHDNATTTGIVFGIYAYYCYNGYQINGNRIVISPATTGYGIRDYYCNYYSNYNATMANGLISNNFITVLTGTTTHGINTYYSTGTIIAYNSVNILAGSTNGYAVHQTNTTSNTYGGQSFFNNNLVNMANTYAAYFATTSHVAASNNNNFFTNGPNLAYWGANRATLAALQGASGKDQNSKNVNPGYFSSTDLHMNNQVLDGAATPLASVLFDIDGELRDPATPDIGADEVTLIPNDCGISQLIAPLAQCPGVSGNVVVEMKNYGILPLTSCTIGWSINGVVQTPYAYSGNLANNGTAQVTLGTITLTAGTPYQLQFWTSQPNGVADQNTLNDTLAIQNFYAALPGGNYTIGSAPTDTWSTFQAAAAGLQMGVCGPVVIKVKDGTYAGPVEITQIPGTSQINTVTFESFSNDSTAVTLSSSGTTLKLNGASYVTLRKMTISTTATAAAYAIELLGGASHNTITNCRLTAAPSTTSTSRVVQSSTGNDDYNTYSFNRITGGYYGMYIYGASTSSYEKGTVIEGNVITGFYYYGMYVYYQDSVQVIGNTVRDNAATSGYIYGIASGYCFNGYNISGNKISITPGTYGYALRDYYNNYYTNYTPTMAPGLVSNNFITVHTGTYAYGIYSYYTNNVQVVYNSVNILAGSTNGYGLYQYNTASNTVGQTFLNNSFSNRYGGYAAYFSTPAQVAVSDYNNYFTTGSTLAYWTAARANLAALKAASGKDASSISADPKYFTNTDLHLILSPLNNMGTPVAAVQYDIDGEPRSAVTPDIGADEFTPPSQDITMLSLNSPAGSGCNEGLKTVEVDIMNTGSDPIQGNLTLYYSLDKGVTSVSEIIGTNIPTGDTLTVTFAVQANFAVTQDSVFNVWVWAVLTGDYLQFNDSIKGQFHSKLTPVAPVIQPATTAYSTPAVLNATSAHTVKWYATSTSTTVLGTGLAYTTAPLFTSKWFFAEAQAANGCVSTRDSVQVTLTNVPVGDLGISAINVNQGCGLTANETVTIDVYNQGTGTISTGATATFRIGNGPWITPEVISAPIASGATIQYAFTATANLYAPADTTFTIQAAITLGTDPYTGNDTLMLTAIESFYTPADPAVTSPITIPYGTAATISVPSTDTIVWFANPADTIPLAGGTLITPLLFDTTTYYAQALVLGTGGKDSLALAPAGGTTCGGGNMFDVKALNQNQAINAMTLRFNTAGTKPVRVYYRLGSFSGAETDSTLWIYHDEATVVTTASGALAKFSIKPLNLPVGQTVGIYAMYDANYASGANVFQNSDLSVSTGVGLCSAFGGLNNPRTVSGFLHYSGVTAKCSSARIPVVIQTTSPPPVDAGMAAIINPVGSVISGLALPVVVTIKNYGTDTLNSVNITYQKDGAVQGVFPWTGSLEPGAISSPITLTTSSFTGGMHQIRFWVSDANGTTGGVNGNDTISAAVLACLSGTYTLGTPSSDYPTFSSAISALNTSGVCGDVTFLIEPGTYNGQITFSPTAGAGPNSRITFESSTGDSTDVIIQHTSTAATYNWTVRFDGADYYTLKGVTVKAMDATNGTAIEMINGANWNVIEHCDIQSTGIVSTCRGIYDYNTMNHYNTYRNNRISGGYTGLYVNASSATVRQKGTLIDGNDISGFYYYGIYAYYQDSLKIRNNKIHSNATTTGYIYGIYTYYNYNGMEISGNHVSIAPGTYGYAIRCYYTNYSTNYTTGMLPGRVFNNFISITSGTYAYGLYAYYSNDVTYDFNTVNITSGTTNGYALYQSNTSSNSYGQSFRNNIFVNTSIGYAAYFATPASVNICNYNNYYATGSSFGYWGSAVANLAALKAASGKDANSLSVNPFFNSATDLHVSNFMLNGSATPISGITTDIDGNPRNPATPDIGADEFDPVPNDAGVVALVTPTSPLQAGINAVRVKITNYGNDTLTTVTIHWSVNQLAQAPYVWTGSLATGQYADSVLLGNFNFGAGASYVKAWTSMPNGVADMGPFNDTINAVVIGCQAPMKGVYTIGGTGSDYQTIGAAIMALNYCGVDSAVVMRIAPGVYQEKLVVGQIPGASALNTVTFRSSTGDSTDVVITWGQPTGIFMSTVTLDATQWVTFSGVTISSSATGGSYVLYLTNGASRNNFTNCVIAGPQTSSSATRTLMVTGGGLSEYNTFTHNVIKGGYYTAYIYGTGTASLAKGNRFENNRISDFYYYGFYGYYQDSMIFRNNYITENSTGSAYYPATFGYCDNYLEVSGNTLELRPSSYTYGLRIYYCDGISTQQGRVFNNNISITSGTGTSYGLYIYTSNYQNVGFNNVNLTAGGTSSRAAYVYNGGSVNFMNNNLVTTIAAYTMYYTGSGLANSNHNNYYTPYTRFAYFSSDLTSLSAWQLATGKDQNSISVDPGYYAPNNLHVMNVALNNAGIPFNGVTVDIDGELRNLTAPDIGSDEFSPLPIDLDVMAITQPALHYAPVGTQHQVEALVRNLGTDTITSFTLNYTYTGLAPVSSAWTGSLVPGANTAIQFTLPITVVAGAGEIKVYLDALGAATGNDTMVIVFNGIPVVSLSYTTGFDLSPDYWFAEGSNKLWQHGVPTGSKINTAHSAARVWATNLSGQYGSGHQGEYLYSPYFDFSGASGATLKFWHWREIAPTTDGCHLQYSLNGGQTWNNLGFMGDPNATNWYTKNFSGLYAWEGTSNGWVQSTFALTSFNNLPNPVQFRFHFFSDGSSFDDGFALDDFEILLPNAPNDAGVTAITSPTGGHPVGNQVNVSVTFKNYGTSTQTTIPLELILNGVTITTEWWTGSLPAQGTGTYTFVLPYTVPSAAYQLCAKTVLPGDAYPSNDEYCVNLGVLPAQNDVGAVSVVSPLSDANGNICYHHAQTQPWYQYTTIVRIRNFGSAVQSSIPVKYSFSPLSPVHTDTWTGVLNPGDSADFTLSQLFLPASGLQQLCAETNLTGDVVTANNKTCKNYVGVACTSVEDEEMLEFSVGTLIPNPASINTVIPVRIPASGQVKCTVHDPVGRVYYEGQSFRQAGSFQIFLDVTQYASGVYYYSVEYQGQRITRKLVVRK